MSDQPAIGLITVQNAGPIVEFALPVEPGVTVLRGRNERGKSTMIMCVDSIARGGKSVPGLEIRHGAEKAIIKGLGLTVTITEHKTSKSGESEVDSTEKIAYLENIVKPGFSDPKVNSKSQIKSLITLSGKKAESQQFIDAVPAEVVELLGPKTAAEILKLKGDPVELASSVREILHKAAKELETASANGKIKAKALRESRDLSFDDKAPSVDEAKALIESATSAKEALRQQKQRYDDAKAAAEAARAELGGLETAQNEAASLYEEYEAGAKELSRIEADLADLRRQESELKAKIIKAEKDEATTSVAVKNSKTAMESAKATVERIKAAETKTNAKLPPVPSEIDFAAADDNLDEALKARDRAVAKSECQGVINQIKATLGESERQAVDAAKIREAAVKVDAALQSCLEFPFSVSDGLLTVQRGPDWVEKFSELSDGAKYGTIIEYCIASARRLDRPAILPLGQIAWEGLDAWRKNQLHLMAKKAGVAIITAGVGYGSELTAELYELDPLAIEDATGTDAK